MAILSIRDTDMSLSVYSAYPHEGIVLLGITVSRRRGAGENIVVVVVIRTVTADIGADLSHKDSPRPMMMTTTTITKRRLLRVTRAVSLPPVLISAGCHKLLYSSSRSPALYRETTRILSTVSSSSQPSSPPSSSLSRRLAARSFPLLFPPEGVKYEVACDRNEVVAP